mmetsp:Transcript_46579/g.39299  ORF Transcript_46579/g.39299 Transcript_46579/m.39299 type:complete len:166 (-) Transcript_46579:1054-1551(-)
MDKTHKDSVEVDPKDALTKLSNKLSVRGTRGLLSFAKAFKKADVQKNYKVDFDIFKEICVDHLIIGEDFNNADTVAIYQLIDSKHSGVMNYKDLLRVLRGPLSNFRRTLLERVFDSLDAKRSGHVEFEILKLAYTSINHPDVQLHRRCEEEVLGEFLETLDLWRF